MDIGIEELITVYNMPPDEAIEWFEQQGLAPAKSWKEVTGAVNNDAFAVAGVTKMNLVTDLKSIVETAIDEGLSFNDFKNTLTKDFSLRTWHAELVINQNVANAYNAGRWDRQQSTKKNLPYVRFVLGSKIDHTPGCLYLAMNRIVVAIDDPDIASIYPPRHFRCGTGAYVVTADWVKANGYTIKKVSEIPAIYLNAPGFRRTPNIPLAERVDLDNYPPQLAKLFKQEVWQ